MKILIVEDDFFSQDLLREMLNPYGIVHAVCTGLEAIELFKNAISENAMYTLVCLDINLPDASGHEILQQMRGLEQIHQQHLDAPCKIVMTTSLDDGANIMNAFRQQCDGYLVKPFSLDKLQTLLTELELIDPNHN